MADSRYEGRRWKPSRRDVVYKPKRKEIPQHRPTQEERYLQQDYLREKAFQKIRTAGALPGDHVKIVYWRGKDPVTHIDLGKIEAEGIIGYYVSGKKIDQVIHVWSKGGGELIARFPTHILVSIEVLPKVEEAN